ncbi:uncharacterized protein EI90DRAFT_3115358 [Cantharellus anzutake]|uniref:uncharacterized protein n=1 Tax=Cantharellus anzutake TaxID=1750568 RepID=UPI001903B8F4|nr:uncharacterized protein EI90DRAFT_3115358 [Cantharellus anzutake]KAF8342822.1 hypothetical protein EI90DRAFT_3115358 [Cantharellus anzutake]
MASRPPPSHRATAPMPGLANITFNTRIRQQAAAPEFVVEGHCHLIIVLAILCLTSVIGLRVGPKVQRTSKVSQKLVELPLEPQTGPLTDVPHHRSEAERMSTEEREQQGYPRLTAYCIAEGFRSKALAAFLKREHGVSPRVFDEAIYAAYHLPLLPGYAPNVNVRSSAPSKSPGTRNILFGMSQAEEYGYDGSYFTTPPSPINAGFVHQDGYISSSPNRDRDYLDSDTDAEQDSASTEPESSPAVVARVPGIPSEARSRKDKATLNLEQSIGEVVIFDYGVAVFLGFHEQQEHEILEDVRQAELCIRLRPEVDWEIEQHHYMYDAAVQYPRIYNDFFTFKTPSHLLTLSLAHALAQSTLLAHYETTAQTVLLDPQTVAIPRRLATTGSLQLRRADALKLTGKLFRLRRDVNLVSNVLDTPELFWSEASLKDLYDACRDYFEITSRAQVLNDRLAVASDLLDLIHEHLNTGAMDKITWIIIWSVTTFIPGGDLSLPI